MNTIHISPCYLTFEEMKRKIQELFPNKTKVPLKVTGFPQITLCDPTMFLDGGIYWGLNRVTMKMYFYAVFNANELFVGYTLRNEYNPVIVLTRKVGYFPDYDTPNGFSEIEVQSYKRLTANKLEVDPYFTFSMLELKSNLVTAQSSMTHNVANYKFENLSTLKENYITFEVALGHNLKKLNQAFQILCEFHFELNRKK